MEKVLKVEVSEELSKLIVKGLQRKPTEEIEKVFAGDLEEEEEGREYLTLVAKTMFIGMGQAIPEAYRGKIEFELKMMLV